MASGSPRMLVRRSTGFPLRPRCRRPLPADGRSVVTPKELRQIAEPRVPVRWSTWVMSSRTHAERLQRSSRRSQTEVVGRVLSASSLARRSGMRDRAWLIFAAASALVALHAVGDAFIWPEQGTTGSDHLLPGLVTLGVLAAGLVAFGFSRPGLRAVLALVLGPLALEGAVLAVLHARNVGARGDDWTGFLLAPAGLALCLLGIVLLWRSRKPGRLRWPRRAGLALAALLGAYWVVAPLAMAIVATHRPREAVAPVALGMPYQHVTLRTGDGLRLAGWYVRSRNGAAVVSYPTRKGKLPQARMLIRHGYGVLLLDARG